MSKKRVNPVEEDDEHWNELFRQFEDTTAVTSPYIYSSDAIYLGSNPTNFVSGCNLWDKKEFGR